MEWELIRIPNIAYYEALAYSALTAVHTGTVVIIVLTDEVILVYKTKVTCL